MRRFDASVRGREPVLAEHSLLELSSSLSYSDIREGALEFCRTLRVEKSGRFVGYKVAASSASPSAYGTVAALLLRHLLGVNEGDAGSELHTLAELQCSDGIFRDRSLGTTAAETGDWWGHRHLTLHILMTFGLYQYRAVAPIQWALRFGKTGSLRRWLEEQDWGDRAAWTSNAVQNLGVMLQYCRDYLAIEEAASSLQVLNSYVLSRQDPETGLYGAAFDTPTRLSHGVQAGYHFWLLLDYDGIEIPHRDRIAQHVLRTQNLWGGYGVTRFASACEDIDSIDPLYRFGRDEQDPAMRRAIQHSLLRALSHVVGALNDDGGWVFRRGAASPYGLSPVTATRVDESDLFFTWFRLLGLAYLLEGLGDSKALTALGVTWHRAPGLQFPRMAPAASS